jgi:hypothetical protein
MRRVTLSNADLVIGSMFAAVPPPSAYVGAPNRTQGLVSSFFRPKTLCLICRYDDQVQDILVHKQPNLKFTSTTSLFLHLTTRL